MSPSTQNDPPPVITGAVSFRWDVFAVSGGGYTIEEHDEDQAYVGTNGKDNNVYVEHYPKKKIQKYNIEFAAVNIYKIYLLNTTKVLQCNGDGNQVSVAHEASDDSDAAVYQYWYFEEANGPYEYYGDYFLQDSLFQSIQKVYPHFGLLPLESDSQDRWTEFWTKIDDLNKGGEGSTFYKVFFLGRHGEGVHNIAMRIYKDDWPDESGKNGDGDLTWGPDAALTQEGYLDAANVHSVWLKEQEAKIGLPQISYCSPLTRCLVTNTITFGFEVYEPDVDEHSPNQPSKLNTIVVENCRERCSGETPEKRQTKTYISEMFTKFSIEDGFTEDDKLWTAGTETWKAVRQRARQVLSSIFTTGNEGVSFVSITTHAGFIKSFVRVIGRGEYSLPPGGVLPIVCKYTSASAYDD